MEKKKINEILRKHELWLNCEDGGERANLGDADLRHANLGDADLNYSCWPLWCGSLKAYVDDCIAIQLLYHTLSVVQHSPHVSAELKRTLLTSEMLDIANRFHRVEECGALEPYEAEQKEA